MDRFVTRTPTWKTLNYSSLAAQSYAQKNVGTLKRTPADSNKKKPLQPKQLSDFAAEQTYDYEKRMVDLLPAGQMVANNQQINADNYNGNSNDSGLSSASSISPQQLDDNVAGYNASPYKKHLGKLSDYIDCPIEKENDTFMTITRSPKSHKKIVLESKQPQVQKTLESTNKFTKTQVQGTPDRPLPSTNNMLMARIQRDLNSPSAAARMKAIKALKSPTKSAYTHFDIPEAEQSLHIPEPPSLEEIMRNIVVYVEVRSGEDNRSAGVRKVIEALGARVNLSLNRDTTHVVFKDGLLSTFKKATQMNIPIVSILWIEACKNQRRICDPKDYPISNLDRYENPELYTKMKRVKYMQPDSECNKRIRVKGDGTPKESTPTQKTGNLKKTSTFIGGTPTSSTNKKKTDISQFFKKLEKATPNSSSAISKVNGEIPESPATQLLNRINSECYTPLNELKKKTTTNETKENNDKDIIREENDTNNIRGGAKKVLDFLETQDTSKDKQENTNTSRRRRSSVLMQQNAVVEIEATMEVSTTLTTQSGKTRRHSLMANCDVQTTTNSMNNMVLTNSTPSKSTRRRSSIHTTKDMSLTMETPSKMNIEPIIEESDETEHQPKKPPKSATKRRTLYAAQTMEQTNLLAEVETPSKKSSRRRTLYAPKNMETTEIKEVLSNVSVRRRTCYSVKSLEQTETPTETTETLGKKSVELTNEIEMNTPSTKTTNRRRTLYGAPTISESYRETSNSSPNITTNSNGSSICLTPTNFQTGKVVASSTLLEDSDNRSKLVATPPADAISGKLLEETEQCATPLIFSSTRQPGNKRRTLFDVSMDIITQRLQCINQSARRSLAPPTPSAEMANVLEKSLTLNTPNDINKSKNLPSLTTPQTSTETLNECTISNEGIITPETNTLKKKRKLFMPNELLVTPPPPTAKSNNETLAEPTDKLPTNNRNNNSVQKRRRTLMPISQPQPTTVLTLKDSKVNSTTSSSTSVRKRRSTLDFEQIQTIKTKALNNAAAIATQDISSSSTTSSGGQTKTKTKKSSAAVLVYTNMHQKQIDVIREVGTTHSTPTNTKQ